MTQATAPRAGQRVSVLSVMEPGTLYRTADLIRLSGYAGATDVIFRRISNLQRQGRLAFETRETRSGSMILWRLP